MKLLKVLEYIMLEIKLRTVRVISLEERIHE